MDPNETLRRMREIAARILALPQPLDMDSNEVDEFAELFQALDD